MSEQEIKTDEISQEKSYRMLVQAIHHATASGFFDSMAAQVHPDVINRFCEALEDLDPEDLPPPRHGANTDSRERG